MKELDDYRNVIDNIDEIIAKLFCKRMEVVDLIKEVKKENDIRIEDIDRENEVLNHVAAIADEQYQEECKKLYGAIFEISKSRQNK